MRSSTSASVGAAGSFFASLRTPGGTRGAVSMIPCCAASRSSVLTKPTGPLALRFSISIARANPRRAASPIALRRIPIPVRVAAPSLVGIEWFADVAGAPAGEPLDPLLHERSRPPGRHPADPAAQLAPPEGLGDLEFRQAVKSRERPPDK